MAETTSKLPIKQEKASTASLRRQAWQPFEGLRQEIEGVFEDFGPNHPNQQRPVTAQQSKTRWRLPQCNVQLMTEQQVLGFKPTARLKPVGEKYSEHIKNRKHCRQ